MIMTTQFASASYQEVVDLHTESDTVSVIGIHTPQGDTPRKMFGGFFEQFKKFKYLGCSIKLVPAARLPADPLQVSYDAGEPTIDPRDMLNPLMFHGCHGNDMGVILNRLYALNSGDRNSDSINFIQDDTQWSLAGIAAGEFPNFQLEDLYYKALTDNTWKKAHPQRGFRKSGLRPLVYKMATNLQMLGTGSSLAGEVGVDGIPMGPAYDSGSISLPVTQSGRQFFTPGLTGLGWLDTRNVLTDYKPVEIDLPITEEEIPDLEAAIRNATLAQQNASESSLPLVYMGMILLPPAYKTEQYFRMVINHHFAFKDFRGISFSNNLAVTPAYDNFNADETEDPDDPDPPSPPGPDPPIADAVVLTLGGLESPVAIHASENDSSIVGFLTRAKTVTITGGQYDGATVTFNGVSTVNNRPPFFAGRLASDNTTILEQLWVGGDKTAGAAGIYYYDSQNTVYWPSNSSFPRNGSSESDATSIATYVNSAIESVEGAKTYLLGLIQNGLTTETVVFADE